MTPKVYSYSRFSRPEQARGDSLRRQQVLAENYAKVHGLELDRSLKADEGLSAFSGANLKRGHLGQFMEKVRAGKVPRGSILLVESLDRLSREDVLEALPLFIEILKLGVRVVTLCDNQLYDESSVKANPMTLMMSLLTFARANEESAIKAKRLKAAWANKRACVGQYKLTSQCPAWLKLSAEKKSFEVILDRVAIVERLFRLAREGRGKSDLAKMLNQEGVEPWGQGKRKAYIWHESYIQKILTNRAVFGEFCPHAKIDGKRVPTGETLKMYFPAIISESDFDDVQFRRAKRRLKGGRRTWDAEQKTFHVSNLFTHLAYCGRCGAALHYLNKGKGRKGGTYIVCARALRGAGCEYRSIQYPKFERYILRYLHEIDWGQLSATAHLEVSELGTIKARIDDCSSLVSKNDKTISIMVDGIAETGLNPRALVSKINELEDANAQLNIELKRLNGEYQSKSAALQNSRQQGASLREKISSISSSDLAEGSQQMRTLLRDQLKFLLKKVEVLISPTWEEFQRFHPQESDVHTAELLFPHHEKNSLFASVEFSLGTTRRLFLSDESEVAQEVFSTTG